jgi:hypothetical protein
MEAGIEPRNGLLSTRADERIDELIAHFGMMWAADKPDLWQAKGLDQPEWRAARGKAQLDPLDSLALNR